MIKAILSGVLLGMLLSCATTPKPVRPVPSIEPSIIGQWRAVESSFSDFWGAEIFEDVLEFKRNHQVRLGYSLSRKGVDAHYVVQGNEIKVKLGEDQRWKFKRFDRKQRAFLEVQTSTHKTVFLPSDQFVSDKLLGQWRPKGDQQAARLVFFEHERCAVYLHGQRKAWGTYRLWDAGDRGLRLVLLLVVEGSESVGMSNYHVSLGKEHMRITPFQNNQLINEAIAHWVRDDG